MNTKWWQALLLVGFSTAIPFLILEAFLHTRPISHGPESIPSSIPGVAYTYAPNKEYAHPGSPLRVNRWGTIGEDFPEKKEPGELRVFVVGDSVVLSQGFVHTGFIKILQKRFDEQPPVSGRRVRFIQAGIASHGTCQEKQLIKHAYGRFEPDLFVIGYAVNDVEGPRIPFGLNIQTGKVKWWAQAWHFVKNRVRTLKWLKHHLSPIIVRLRGPGTSVAPVGANPADGLSYVLSLHDPKGPFWQRWKGCVEELGETKTPILFVVVPLLKPFDAPGMEEAYSRVEFVAKGAGLAAFNLHDSFKEAGAAGRTYGIDDMHLNQEGHDLVSRALEPVLRAQLTGVGTPK